MKAADIISESRIGGTLIAYYFICKRKLFLHAKNIRFENYDDRVQEARVTHENSFKKETDKELNFDQSKFDFIRFQDKILIHEVKHSRAIEEAAIWQVKYYIYLLRKRKIDCDEGSIHYPKLMRRIKVSFGEADEKVIEQILSKIREILSEEWPPEIENKFYCRKCSFYEYCYV